MAFRKSGPLVKASLAMGTKGPGPEGLGRFTFTVAAKAWARHESLRSKPDQHFFLTATNSGRAAIWVSQVGLCSAGGSVNMNVTTDASEGDAGFGPSLPFKLDAGQTAIWAIGLGSANTLWRLQPNADADCVHGELALGSGVSLRTKEGVRLSLVRETLRAQNSPRRGAATPSS